MNARHISLISLSNDSFLVVNEVCANVVFDSVNCSHSFKVLFCVVVKYCAHRPQWRRNSDALAFLFADDKKREEALTMDRDRTVSLTEDEEKLYRPSTTAVQINSMVCCHSLEEKCNENTTELCLRRW